MILLQPDGAHYYGFSYFRQVKDKGNKRGYFQKVCFVILFTFLVLFHINLVSVCSAHHEVAVHKVVLQSG